MCTTKFDIEEKELAFINQFLTKDEREAGNEEKDAQAKDTLDPISDNEEDDIVPIQEQPATQGVSLRALGKRRKSITSEPEDEAQESALSDDNDPPLPNTQRRALARSRKRSRRDDDIFTYY
jgi:hypothetical protein